MAKLGENITTEYGALSYDAWDRATEYKQYQRVQHNGLVYAAKGSSTGIAPGTDDDAWELLDSLPVEQGDGRDSVVFTTGDKKQTIAGKSINSGKGVSVGKNQVSNTINANTDDETVKVNDKNKLYVPTATAGSLGVVRAGTGISIDEEGTISANIPVADEHKIGSKDGIAPFFITEDAETKKTIITGNSIVSGDNTTVAQKGEYTYGVDVPAATTEKPGVVQVGSGLSVNNGVISAQEYKAGEGITIADGTISAKTYTAGEGISISDNVISVNYPNGDTVSF